MLLWNHYVVPDVVHRPMSASPAGTASAIPRQLPNYAVGFPDLWWWDEEKAKKVQPTNDASRGRGGRPCCSYRSRASAEPRHGISAFGDLKYPADFTHFDYVNPDAPKGGKIATIGIVARDTFD